MGNATKTIAMGKRSQGRALAMQALCLFDALGDSFAEQLATFLHDPQSYEDLGIEPPVGLDVLAFARTLATNAWAHRPAIDKLLAEAAPRWSIARMPPVDRNILRLGVYELTQTPETPPAIVIDEAIELAKRFSGAESGSFVNGILDSIRRAATPRVEPQPPSTPTDPQAPAPGPTAPQPPARGPTAPQAPARGPEPPASAATPRVPRSGPIIPQDHPDEH